MECSNQRGEAELIGTFHLSPNENILKNRRCVAKISHNGKGETFSD